MLERIKTFLTDRYNPISLIVYGSYADGTAGLHSDFDALLIYDGPSVHDSSIVEGITLDVFCYSRNAFCVAFEPKDFVQIWDGIILLDQDGTAKKLQKAVISYIGSIPKKSRQEITQSISWCEKMLRRASRGDAEGFYRWHWLLSESLEIYFDILGEYYYGPKKSLSKLRTERPSDFAAYEYALECFSFDALVAWVACLKHRAEKHVD